ncbi:Hypothetical protein NTJ_03046 [Nesidiocoris tenuis]|uniref:Uncharacterized protein n=1 Tax=Nesidiocoris tenuis TaxID=355587 RepID=A0ABN7AD64_9HEMI|nr:Hypothetical protein NTJ_03046 [Nesidiocoris tenuis]
MTKLTASAKKRKRETFDDPFGCSHQPSEAVKSPRISRRKQAFATRYDFEEEAPMSRPVAARRLLLETEPNPLISSEPNVSSKPANNHLLPGQPKVTQRLPFHSDPTPS